MKRKKDKWVKVTYPERCLCGLFTYLASHFFSSTLPSVHCAIKLISLPKGEFVLLLKPFFDGTGV
jgi:hypothetical protein